VVSVDPSRNGYKGQRLRDFYERLRAGAEALPGVRSVSLAFITPLAGSRWNNNITVEGYSPKPGERTVVDMNAVGPRYFETLGIPILLGRDFTDRDQPPYSPDPPETFTPGVHPPEPPGPRVAIVTASFAQRFFAGRNPVGGRICQGEKLDAARTYEVVGVVKDAHYFGLREALEPMVYMPVWRAETGFGRTLCLRTSLEAPALVDAVRRQVTALDPGVPVLTTRTIEQQIDQNILVERLIATLASFFGSLALLLAGVGLYGVISYGVTRRTREIGIRMALGAQRAGVLWLIVRDAVVLVAAGAAVGLPAALALTRLVQTFLFGVSPQDPWSLAGGAAVLAAVAALASVLPARRAARVDPVVALRYE
jgi:predicted permease